jgi:GT2 family glycosyltransferase
MTARVDLVWLGDAAEPPAWPLGAVLRAGVSARAVHEIITTRAGESPADAWLFWDGSIAPPHSTRVADLLAQPGDIWHAGLSLGLASAPAIIDFITPTWTFNRDPDASIGATSWRVSLRACLVRTSVLRWSAPQPDFDSLDGASLEWGHRCISRGVLPRHVPSLLPPATPAVASRLTLADQLRFARLRFGTKWSAWAAFRAAFTGYARLEDIADALLAARSMRPLPLSVPYERPSAESRAPRSAVTVLIPTLDRYDYLRKILGQLSAQTVHATEVIVVDQTPPDRSDAKIAGEFAGLPLQVMTLDQAGQCTSRNAGLVRARGEAILFVDDDDEIAPDLIERHLDHLARSGGEVSSGVAQEPSSGELPSAFRVARAADVFPTNNTLARRSALERSGLFDLAYDHGARADGDLGMRVYLSGAVMMLDPAISVLHHHAPRGGLRAHGARVITYGSSRRRLMHRQLPEVTELYRSLRYFSDAQVREAVAQAALGTLSSHGGIAHRAAKMILGMFMMPDTVWRIRERLTAARAMLATYPQIPAMPARAR